MREFENSTNRRKVLNGGNVQIGEERNVATKWWKGAYCSQMEEMN
jgi:hypothetical protein